MTTRRTVLASLAFCMALPLTAIAQTPPSVDSQGDRNEIIALVNAYASALDEGRIADTAALFAKAEFTIEGLVTVQGSTGVADLFSDIILYEDGTPRTKHVVTNVLVELSDDRLTARAQSYLTVFQQVDNTALQPIFSGAYADSFGRDGETWHFTQRVISGALFGDMRRHLRNPPKQ